MAAVVERRRDLNLVLHSAYFVFRERLVCMVYLSHHIVQFKPHVFRIACLSNSSAPNLSHHLCILLVYLNEIARQICLLGSSVDARQPATKYYIKVKISCLDVN
jgi:hypothetical protein